MVSPVTDPTRPSFSNPVQNQGCGHLAEDSEGSWGREQGTGPACSSSLLMSPSPGTLDMGSAVEPWSFSLWGIPAGGSRDTVGPPALLLEMLQPPEVHQGPVCVCVCGGVLPAPPRNRSEGVRFEKGASCLPTCISHCHIALSCAEKLVKAGQH